MTRNTDHCVMDSTTQEFVCKRCGARRKAGLPMPITEFVRASESFSRDHRVCTANPSTRAAP